MAYNTTSYESFYGGGPSSLSPDYGNFTGYRMSAAQLGFPGSIQTANQLGETVNAIKHGTKAFEVSMLTSDVAETIPKQHFAEMKALMKLSGVKPSVHGPMIDAAGFDEKGNWGNGFGREDAERRMFDTLEKASLLDSNGNVPVVFHSSAGTPGAEFRPGKKEWGEEENVMQRGAMINRETGAAQAIKREYKLRPEHPELLEKEKGPLRDSEGRIMTDSTGRIKTKHFKGRPAGLLFSAESTIGAANLGDWEEKLMGVAQMNKHAEEIMGSAPTNLRGYENAAIGSVEKKEIFEIDAEGRPIKKLPWFDSGEKEGQAQAYSQIRKAGLFLENAELSFKGAFHQAYKYGDDNQKKALKALSTDYAKKLKASSEVLDLGGGHGGLNILGPANRSHLITESLNELRKITDPERGGKIPEVYQESNAFAMDKAAETFGNLAKKSYDKLGGKKAPVLAIEPFHPGAGLFETKDMKKLVEKSRDIFSKQLVEEKGLSKKEADKIAESKIGVTWDVGHINMIKKYGFTDKDVIKQTKLIAPMVKHVHLTDNFGYADTHLAPGMGNVPIKGILEELEKTGRLDEMRKITEAGAFVQHFKKSPHALTMAAFGSPIYGMKSAPYWNQVMDVQGSYFGGYGTINPSQHHSMYGSGFTTMPIELGGQMPGGQSRFGGAPMA
ncbi:MAG: hypothetical protein ABIF18_01615 [archaeon]